MVLNFNSKENEYDYTKDFCIVEKKQEIQSQVNSANKKVKIITNYDQNGKLKKITTMKLNDQIVFNAEFQNDIQIKNETYQDNGLLATKVLYNLEGKPISEENYDEYGNIELIKTFSYYKNGNIRSEKIEDKFGEHEVRYHKNGQISYQSHNGKTIEYDEFGLETKFIDTNGNITRYEYDDNGIKKYELIELKYFM